MADDNTFAQEFQQFLQTNAFTDELAPEQITARTDIMISALANHLRSQFGTERDLTGTMHEGKVGGGVPHLAGPVPRRMDLLLEYAMDASH